MRRENTCGVDVRVREESRGHSRSADVYVYTVREWQHHTSIGASTR